MSRGKHITEEEFVKVKLMQEDGMKPARVAQVIGRPVGTVKDLFRATTYSSRNFRATAKPVQMELASEPEGKGDGTPDIDVHFLRLEDAIETLNSLFWKQQHQIEELRQSIDRLSINKEVVKPKGVWWGKQ